MKKISLFILFALFVLRGPQMSAQVCDSVPFTINYASCGGAAAPLTITYSNTGITYTFKLDGVASPTNSWQNVSPTFHTITYTGSNGCTGGNYGKYLTSKILQLTVQQQPRANCSDSLGSYRLNVYNGQAPYIIKINGTTTTNTVASLREGIRYNINIKDALGCMRDTTYTAAPYQRDSVSTRFNFVPNSACDSVGTVTFLVNNQSLARPFSISLNGQPYVNDTVLRNTRLFYGNNNFLLKTATGCVYQGRFISTTLYNSAPDFSINYTSCGSPAPLSIDYTFINNITYAFRLDGVASPNNTWQNVLPGRHTLGYTSSNGCTRADSTPILLGSTASIAIYATEVPQQRTCVDSVRLFRLTAYGGQAPYTFNINDNPSVATKLST